MQIEERFVIDAPVERVWNFLLDTQSVAACVPGCEAVKSSGENSYTAKMKVKVGPISANFDVQIDITEMNPPTMLRSAIKGKDSKVASSLNASTVLDLADVGSGKTEMHYKTDVSVFGRLGTFGEGVMKKKAKEYGEMFACSLKGKLEGGSTRDLREEIGGVQAPRWAWVRRFASWIARLFAVGGR
jgi:carbon monoxide dehydrogenase subunit G